MNLIFGFRFYLVVLGLSLSPSLSYSQVIGPSEQSFIDHILDKKFWYGIYVHNTHGGYATDQLKIGKYNGEEVYVYDLFIMTAEETEQGGDSSYRERLYFSLSTGLMLGCLSEYVRDEKKIDSLSGSIINGKWIITDYSNIKRTVDINRYTITDFFDNEAWVRSEPNTGSTNVYYDFECETYEFVKTLSTVVKKGKRNISGKTIKYISTHDVSDDLNSYASFAADGVVLELSTGTLSLKLQDEKSATSYYKLSNYSFHVPLSEKIESYYDISKLTLEISGVEKGEIETDFNQKVSFTENGVVRLTLGAGFGKALPVSSDDVHRFLKATAQYPTDHPIIREAFSNMKIRGPVHEYILAYVSNILEDDYNANTSNVVEILNNKKGDCTEHSILFITLARLAGIPAREVSGFVYNGDSGQPGLAGHAWAEIALDGYWVAVDPTWGEFVVNPTHIKIAASTVMPDWRVKVVNVSYYSESQDMADDAYERNEYKIAFSLYEKQGLLGNRYAQYSLGWMYLQGEGVSKDELEAQKWLRLAADKGHGPSMFFLGTYYLADDSTLRDEFLSTFWFSNAASQGNLMAAYYLGEAYEKGLGVHKSIDKALFWYKEAAESAFN